MRNVFVGVGCTDDGSARLPVPDKTRRLSESATSAIPMLSLRCLFFTKPPRISNRTLSGSCDESRSVSLDQLACQSRGQLSPSNGLVSVGAGNRLAALSVRLWERDSHKRRNQMCEWIWKNSSESGQRRWCVLSLAGWKMAGPDLRRARLPSLPRLLFACASFGPL